MTKQKFGLTGTALKTIALVLMVMDHIHYFFEFTGVVPEWFSMLARLSAPLFLFCTVEGFAHTHDRRRYFLRIWAIGTAMGTVEFFMIYAGAFRRGDGFYPLNAIFQDLMLLCIVWQGIDWLRQRRFVRGALAAAMPILWPICIVALLMQNPGQVVTRSVILERIAEDTPDCTESSLKTHISHLRAKLRAASGREYVEAVWGIGFQLKTHKPG